MFDNTNHYTLHTEICEGKQRSEEIYLIIKKLVEQNALGNISDEQFASMSADYKKEKKELTLKIADIQAQIDKRDTEGNNTVKFLDAVRKYSEIKELTAGILNDLIDSIVVYDADGKFMKKNRTQRVEINYKFVGATRMDEEKSS